MKKFELDFAQALVQKKLDELGNTLEERAHSWFKPLSCKKSNAGIYIYGPVGRGKTMLVNQFYNSVKIDKKIRLHFHHFMKRIHAELFKLHTVVNPLNSIASKLSKEYQLICLDELFIDDIADASIVGTLFTYLINNGIRMVITSNLHPSELYRNGLHRERALTSINTINNKFIVLELDNKVDYRFLHTDRIQRYFFGSDKENEISLLERFHNVGDSRVELTPLIINGREFNCLARNEISVWFEFAELCEKPRSQLDYIYLAKTYKVLILSNIPQLDDGYLKDGSNKFFCLDRTRRFISLIDELYDQNIIFFAGFQCALEKLYLANDFEFQFKRVLSRLNEMQSINYPNNYL